MGKGKRGQGGMGGGGGGGNQQGGNQGYGGPQGGYQPFQPVYNPYKPMQIALSPTQKSNLRQQIVFLAGDASNVFGSNSDTPCTLHVTIRDPSITIDSIVSEFTHLTGEIPHQDRVTRLVRFLSLVSSFSSSILNSTHLTHSFLSLAI